MVLRELFVRLGLEKDSASFAEGYATVEGLKAALERVAEMAKEAARFLGEQIDKTVEAGVAADRFAQKMGLTTKEVQEFSYVGKTAGLTLDDMQSAMRALALKGVGDLKGTLFGLADQFSKMKDGGYKLGLATEYLGRNGARWIPVLNKGSAAMRQQMQEAEDLGYVMDHETIQATKDYEESSNRLHAALDGLGNVIVSKILTPLRKLKEWTTGIVISFAKWLKGSTMFKTHLTALAVAASILLIPLSSLAVWVFTLAAPFLAWAAAVAVLFLGLDDLLSFLDNKKSVIGDILHAWLGPFDTWQEGVGKIWPKIKGYFEEGMGWLEKEIPPFAARIGAAMEANLKANSPMLGWLIDAFQNIGGFLEKDREKAWALQGWAPGDAVMPGGAASAADAAALSSQPYGVSMGDLGTSGGQGITISQTIYTTSDPAAVGKAASDGAAHGTKKAMDSATRKAQAGAH